MTKDLAKTVFIQHPQFVQNIKFKSGKIFSDRYLQLPNGKIVTQQIYLQIPSCGYSKPRDRLDKHRDCLKVQKNHADKVLASIQSIHVYCFCQLGTGQ